MKIQAFNPVRLYRYLKSISVWGLDGVPEEDRRIRGLLRWVLPILDIAFIWFGLAGWWAGLATVEHATSVGWQQYWSMGIAITSFVALVGVSFPRLWYIEIMGKAPLVGLVFVYLILFISKSTTDPLLWATAGLYCTFALLPIWRLSDLGYIWWRRRVEKEKARITETGELKL